jgi:hypothetical protein
LVYSYSRPNGQDDALPEQKMKILQQLVLLYSCYHEGGHDLVAPSENRDSDGFPQHQPWKIVCGRETLDGEKIMRRKRNLLRAFTLTKQLYL